MDATITLSPNGFNGGFAGSNGGKPGVRGIVQGWSPASARSNMRFLRQIDGMRLPGQGITFTLTVGDSPESGEEWTRLRKQLCQYLTRALGAVCWHHVTEWQERGAPHLHGIFFVLDPTGRETIDLTNFWIRLTGSLGTNFRSQHVVPVDGLVGWLEYMSKHAARGFKHYQRDKENMPSGWAKTGRMWARSRDGWPLRAAEYKLAREAFFLLRRLQDRYAMADARSELLKARRFKNDRQEAQALRRLAFLKHVRKGGNCRAQSEVRGINEWVPENTSRRMVEFAIGNAVANWRRQETAETITLHGRKFSFEMHRPVGPDKQIPF